MITKEFKVDKLGFYKSDDGRLVHITYFRSDYCAGGSVEGGATAYYNPENGKSTTLFAPNLIEFIAPFDVWEYAKGLVK